MSEISEIEIKSMTKEQNYMRGYRDGEFDALNKIREEILGHPYNGFELGGFNDGYVHAMARVLSAIDRFKAENEREYLTSSRKKMSISEEYKTWQKKKRPNV